MANKVVYFKGALNVLSNFHPCKIEFEGEQFESIEHAYQYYKAISHGHSHLAVQIKNAPSAQDAKALSKRVNCNENWSRYKLYLMERLLVAKFEQVPPFAYYLLSTGSKLLIHNVGDNFWGTGGKYGDGDNIFGKMLMELREKYSRVSIPKRVALFGSSYISRLEASCKGNMNVPADVRFFGRGGMKADNIPNDILRELLDFRPDIVFIQIGGNDISCRNGPDTVVSNISTLVNSMEAAGVKDVFVGEIVSRGDFRSPGVDKSSYDKTRRRVNKSLKKLYRNKLINFPNIAYPRDYLSDKVHLNEKGMKSYYLKIRRLLLSQLC